MAAAAYGASARALRSAPASVRACGALIIAWWSALALFYALCAVHGFRLLLALPIASGLAALALGSPSAQAAARECAARDREALRRWSREFAEGPSRWVGVAFSIVLGIRLTRGLVAPPLGWDALTYHLVRAASWVQAGTWQIEPGPDAWRYYAYFPPGGEILWAWLMLPVHGDGLLAIGGALNIGAILLSVYAAARFFEAPSQSATSIALAVGATPAVLAYTTANYVDNTLLACVALGILFVLRALREPSSTNVVLAAAALGLCPTIKLSSAPLAALGLGLVAIAAWRGDSDARRRAMRVGGVGLAAAIVAPPLIRAWLETGSPLYPFGLDLFGRTIFPRDEGFAAVHRAMNGIGAPGLAALIWQMLWRPLGEPMLNLGPAAIGIAAAGAAGLARLFRRDPNWEVPLFLTAAAVVPLLLMASGDVAALRHRWWSVSGRLLTPSLLALAIAGSAVSGRRAVAWFWCGSAAISLALSWPRGLGPPDLRAAAALAGMLLSGALLARALQRRGALHMDTAGAVVALVLCVGVIGAGVDLLRGHFRYAIYDSAARRFSFDPHQLEREYALAWPIWRALDPLDGRRISVSAGWDGVGHNALRYPLMGSRLQHRLLYVSVTASGDIVDYRDESLESRADFRSWLARLVEQRVDLVITLAPTNQPESRWSETHPELFEPFAAAEGNTSRAYRFDRARAARWLERRSSG